MEWWMWVITGLTCLVVEILTPGSFVFVFFAVGALCVGGLAGADILPEFWQQSAAMAVLSVGSLVLFRKRLLQFATPRVGQKPVDTMVGDKATATEAIAVDATGKAEYRGTTWMARNAGPAPIAAGQSCRIERLEGITLWVHGE